jgi:hypothetical protein
MFPNKTSGERYRVVTRTFNPYMLQLLVNCTCLSRPTLAVTLASGVVAQNVTVSLMLHRTHQRLHGSYLLLTFVASNTRKEDEDRMCDTPIYTSKIYISEDCSEETLPRIHSIRHLAGVRSVERFRAAYLANAEYLTNSLMHSLNSLPCAISEAQ